jgi:flagellar hook-basal body complex protein FliE
MSNSITNITTSIPAIPSAATPATSSSPQSDGGFLSSLTSAIEQVEQVHTDAQQQISELLQGNRQDVHNVMIAVEKADVAFQLMMQVRNKIVNAYQEIERLQF